MAVQRDFLPADLAGLAEWSNFFDEKLTANYAAVGCTEQQAADFHALNLVWIESFKAACDNSTRTPSKIVGRNDAKKAMIASARQLVRVIQAHPGTTNEMRENFGITVRKNPTPAAEPNVPFDFAVKLGAIGELKLTWKNKRASGCTYEIQRRIDGIGKFETIAQPGEKKYTDYSVPPRTGRVEYQIRAIRSTGKSDWSMHEVRFGVSEGFEAIIRASEAMRAA